jgi:hypothetical protein
MPRPEELIKADLQRLSDASARLMETLSNLGFIAGLGEDPLKKLVNDMRTAQERIDREIARASTTFIRQTFGGG